MRTLLHLEALKNEAMKRFLSRMEQARTRCRFPSVEQAFLQGMRDGYSEGLVDGVKLGLDVDAGVRESFEAPPGSA